MTEGLLLVLHAPNPNRPTSEVYMKPVTPVSLEIHDKS